MNYYYNDHHNIGNKTASYEKAEKQILAEVIPRVHWRSDHRLSGSKIIIATLWDAHRTETASMRHCVSHVTTTHQLQQRPRQRYVHQPTVLYALGKQCPDTSEQHLHVGHALIVRLWERCRKQSTGVLDVVTSGFCTTTIINLQHATSTILTTHFMQLTYYYSKQAKVDHAWYKQWGWSWSQSLQMSVCTSLDKLLLLYSGYQWLSSQLQSINAVWAVSNYTAWEQQRRVQTTTDHAGSLPCFNPCAAILSYTLWSTPTGTKILSDH